MCSKCVTSHAFRPNWFQWQFTQPLNLAFRESIHLDWGSGGRPSNPFSARTLYIADINKPNVKGEGFEYRKIVNITKIDLPNDSIDSVSAYDLLEHIPRFWQNKSGDINFPFIELMNEVYRILKPGGILICVTPAYPSPQTFQDPTHVNFITEETISYFDENAWAKTLGYGLTDYFQRVHQSWLRGSGPYIGRFPNHQNLPEKQINLKTTLILKYINRIFRMSKKANTFSLLWVLRKPSRCDLEVRALK